MAWEIADFYPAQWDREERVAILWMNDVTADDLPGDDTLRLTPGIFRRRSPRRTSCG